MFVVRLAPPDLTTESGIVVNDSYMEAALRRARRGSHARGSPTNHENIEMEPHFPAHLFTFTSRCSLPCLAGTTLTTADMRISVDHHVTLKANSHATERSTWLTAHRYSASLSGNDNG